MRKSNFVSDNEKLKASSEVLRALAHPLRMRILAFIDKHQSINVNRIYKTLDLEQSLASQHLRILRKAGIVNTEREGKFIHYSLNYGRLKSVREAISIFFAE
jgi:DNA-binding transcriptional ArsR family regulator